ncbi:MAG: response regulator transcription factor [Burkholderiales bacterium]|uniref:response regulator n=1 Tax=Roseateles sp. TaxID=1971397 RepID=UPI000FB2ADCC|nr:MAG: response regulator transcription factor [Burkholderiales bacterium]
MKILLIDDHALFREGVALLLQPLRAGLQTVEAGSCEEGFATLAREGGVDLVLIDLGLPGLSGLDGLARLRADHPDVPVVVMSSADDRDTVLAALDAGAMGFIPKSSTSQVMLGALRLILDQGIYVPPSALIGSRPLPPAAQAAALRPAEIGLTPRQADVLYLLLQGLPSKLIGRALNLSLSTVKAHTTAVLRALNVTTRTQAVLAAGRLGLRFAPPVPAQPGDDSAEAMAANKR